MNEDREVVPLSFFRRDVLEIAPLLPGMILCRRFEGGSEWRGIVTEVEAYRGEEDLACHVSKGRTARTEVMYHNGGVVYVYLIYGMYWMLNVVTGLEDNPQAILIRAVDGIYGPGRLGRHLQLDRSFYGEQLQQCNRLWFEFGHTKENINCYPRIGVDYAGEIWKNKPWRFTVYSK